MNTWRWVGELYFINKKDEINKLFSVWDDDIFMTDYELMSWWKIKLFLSWYNSKWKNYTFSKIISIK